MRDGPGWGSTPIGEVEYEVIVVVTKVRAQSAESACNKVRDRFFMSERVPELAGYEYTVRKAERA